ncbi:hypothetical protein AW40_07175 [Kosakonia radicincitans UMEnt01/12]|uniref:hypothetical protein n=1 Tax=Kosakonia radicincitans TaxID=283686 RepID=UPI00046198D8|nr:hypothetical protein [Kosakonia radicincitans]KDE37420.1 hypothetical protein AW40_07175 [Kosakonia radicincitans UMEnt01/12]
MTDTAIVRLEEFHLDEIFPKPLPPETIAALVSFPSFALECGQKTFAVGGAIQIAPDRVRLWLKTIPESAEFSIRIFRAAAQFTAIAARDNHRVECICTDNLSARVAKMLSYQQDAIIRNYQPGCDARLFSIVR